VSTLVYKIMMNATIVWHVKLPAEWKKIFNDMAEKEHDTEKGAAARALRQFIRKHLEEEKEEEKE